MSKPIEKGCRAVIVNSVAGNDGIIVTVGNRIGHIDGWTGDDRWQIDTQVIAAGGRFDGCYSNHVREVQLKRIDDYNGNEKTTWESMKDIWVPEKTHA